MIMNNKNIKISITLFIVSLLAILIAYGLSFHKLTVEIVGSFDAIIYKQEVTGTKTMATINNSKNIWIRNGIFCVRADDPKYSQIPACVVVNGKKESIKLDPNYSNQHLEELLEPEIQPIHDLIKQTYSPLINNYQIDRGKLLGKGDYYATTIIELSAYYTRKDTYRIILKKIDNGWQTLGKPEIVVNKYNYPDVPRNILSEVNDLVSDIY